MRVLPEAEKVKANYETVATIDRSILKLAQQRKFQVVNATEIGDGLGHALGQTFQSSAGTQFSLIQFTQAPEPTNKYTNIVIALGTKRDMSDSLEVILDDLRLAGKHLSWVRPGLNL